MEENLIAQPYTLQLLQELRQLKEERKATEEREKKVKEMLMEMCELENSSAICNEEGTVLATYKKFEQKRFDTELFKETHIDMYNMYIKTVPMKVFLLKE